jgi:predicted nucleic acid-binding protein
MPFVLDASIAITWAMRDEDHPLADRAFLAIQSDSAIVPGIFWYEIRNVLVLNERRNRISPADSIQFLWSIEQLSIDVDFPQNGTHVMDLSRKHRLSVYDSAYLALAMQKQLPLATLDHDLEAAALAEGVSILE